MIGFAGAMLVVRVLRVLRMARVFKLARYSTSLQVPEVLLFQTYLWLPDVRPHSPILDHRAQHAQHVPHHRHRLLLDHHVLPRERRATHRFLQYPRRLLVVCVSDNYPEILAKFNNYRVTMATVGYGDAKPVTTCESFSCCRWSCSCSSGKTSRNVDIHLRNHCPGVPDLDDCWKVCNGSAESDRGSANSTRSVVTV